MKLLAFLLLFAFATPALGAGEPADDIVSIPLLDSTIYISICRLTVQELSAHIGADGGPTTPTANECVFETGLYQETNKLEKLQTRGVVFNGKAYAPDAHLIA